MSKVAYILSNNRSGSTLLDQLLGGHPRIMSLGEVHHLAAYALQDRKLYDPEHPLDCSCGKSVSTCSFWQAVTARLGRPLDSLRYHLRFLGPDGEVGFRRTIKRTPAMVRNPFLSRFLGSHRLGSDSFALFDAIAEVAGVDYVVDSSKGVYRYRALYNFSNSRVFGIVLVRDYRGVVYSKMKRGRTLEATAREWAARLNQMEMLTRGVPDDRLLRVKYEDLCRDPRAELTRICDFLGLEFADTMLSRPAEEVHHIGGSPSKFDPARRAIRLDESYREKFTDQQLSKMREIVGSAAVLWGYD